MMKAMMVRVATVLAAAVSCTAYAMPAQADWVFRMHNASDVEAKGVVQNVQVVWLRRGQIEDIRVKGRWSTKSCTAGFNCIPPIGAQYQVDFEHLNTPNIKYCVWRITRTIRTPGGNISHGGANPASNVANNVANAAKNIPNVLSGHVAVTFTPTLLHQQPGYICEIGGQLQVQYPVSAIDSGATQNFVVRRAR